MKPSTPSRSQWKNRATVALFLGILLAPSVASLTGLGKVDISEKRRLASLPAPPNNLEQWRQYPRSFDAYFRDHFGLREFLIQCNHRVSHRVFGKVGTSVIAGHDGWLFYTARGVVGNYRGVDPFTEDSLKRWKSVYDQQGADVAERGGLLVWVVAPEKFSVYPEFAPSSLQRVGDSNRLDELLHFLRDAGGSNLVDLRGPLREAKRIGSVYPKTDNHWNDWGATVGATAIQESLRDRFPSIRVLTASDYAVSEVELEGGNLAQLMSLSSDSRETVPVVSLYEPPARVEPPAWVARLPERVRSRVEVFESRAKTGPVAFVLHDSMGLNIRPQLAYGFRRAVFLDSRAWRTEGFEEERPDIVIRLFVERRLTIRRADGSRRD